MTKRTLFGYVLCGASLTLLAGCASTDEGPSSQPSSDMASMAALNEQCPIMGGPIDGSSVAEYEGYTIGFCCGKCVEAWNGKSEAYKRGYVASLTR